MARVIPIRMWWRALFPVLIAASLLLAAGPFGVQAGSGSVPLEPLRFRWPLPAEALVTQATIDNFGNFSLQYRLTASSVAGGRQVRLEASDYRLLYHNRLLLKGRKLDGFDMLGVLHRLTIPTYLADASGGLRQTEAADPRGIEAAFLQNVGSQRAASLREWYVARRPGDFQAVRARGDAYWRVQIPYWEYWIGKWRSLFGPDPVTSGDRQLLHLAGLLVPGRTRLIERLPAPDCPSCMAVAAEDRFTAADLAPFADDLAERLGLTRLPGEAAMTGLRAFVRTEAIIDWQTMQPYRVQAMTIAFQDLADGGTVNADQTKHFFFEWQTSPVERQNQ